MSSLAQVLLSGLQIGSIYALMALSFYVIISATGILNFAQGEWMMVAGVLGLTFLGLGLPHPIAVLCSIIGATLLAVLSERLIIGPLQRRNPPTIAGIQLPTSSPGRVCFIRSW